MHVRTIAPSGADVALSRDELIMLNNALNEVCNGVDIADFEFQTRLGYPRADLEALLDQMSMVAGISVSA